MLKLRYKSPFMLTAKQTHCFTVLIYHFWPQDKNSCDVWFQGKL